MKPTFSGFACSLTEILTIFGELWLLYCIICYNRIYSGGQNNRIKQCSHVGALEHLENWVLIYTKKKELLLNAFFWNLSFFIVLEAVNPNPLSESAPELGWFCQVTRGNFSTRKNHFLMLSQKPFLM